VFKLSPGWIVSLIDKSFPDSWRMAKTCTLDNEASMQGTVFIVLCCIVWQRSGCVDYNFFGFDDDASKRFVP